MSDLSETNGVPSSGSCGSSGSGQPLPAGDASGVNHDEAIMAQEKAIEKEISDSIPLIDNKKPLISLESEYASDDTIYQEKLRDLESRFGFIRKTRPDGNCFFRAFGFAYLESMLSDIDELRRFKDLLGKSKEELKALGFPDFTIDDFHDTFVDVLKRLEEKPTLDELHAVFNDRGLSEYMVVFLRLLTSGQLQKESDFFGAFIEGDHSLKDFCRQEVEPMYKESDHIHIIALTRHLSTGVQVLYMDRASTDGKVIKHSFPDDVKPRVHLLYRPGHYDILYPIGGADGDQ
ncbi:ubiquitin thioesterase OTUB1-like [Varroa jacobsoni]|uniref:Ubiquitin thioesterase n=1 Tax=Varroa destructor TaxID=109461 RepID=A0A7M7JPB4_VARDE|nr:ubiquitin thioesterase OTUB1-like [Varroa destructor]XP_022694181.1 ubiquitin thioesterase OTUB1-like [Varroa jacobsoni]